MGLIPLELIEKIINANDIIDVVSEFVPLKKTGKNFMGVCPFHGDKGPSMSVSKEKQLYHCFGCGASGNVVGFIMNLRSLEYIDAIRYLADRVSINIVEEEPNTETKRSNEIKQEIYQINIESGKYYYLNLIRNQEPLHYFLNRGIKLETIKKFGLGYSNNSGNDLLNYLKSKGHSEKNIFISGLIIKNEKNGTYYDRFRNRVMFPIFDIKKRVIGFGGRVLDDSKPKYLNSPETPVFYKGTNLYGLNFIVKQGLPQYLIIVEGYMDCIALHQYDICNSIASLGTSLTNEQAKLIRRYCKDVYICYDADVAGQTATIRGLEILNQAGCNLKVINIPKGKDPDEFLRDNGTQQFKKLISDAMPVIDYRIKRAKEGKNLKDIEDKSKFLDEVANILSTINNEIEIQAYISKWSGETGIDYYAILDEVNKIKKTNSKIEYSAEKKTNNINVNIYNMEPAYKKAERKILSLMLLNNDEYKYIINKLNIDEFITEIYKDTARYIFDRLDKNELINSKDILNKYQNEKDIRDISLVFTEENDEKYQNLKMIDDLIRTIKKYNIELKIEDITKQIRKCEENREIESSIELSQKLILLKKQNNIL